MNDQEIEVSAETYRRLEEIARQLDCNVSAALEVVLADLDPFAVGVRGETK